MKQKKFGKKVQNWHRPLGKTQLPQRYRQKRYVHTPGSWGHGESEEGWNPWNPLDPITDDAIRNFDFLYNWPGPNDLARYRLLQVVDELLGPHKPLVSPNWATGPLECEEDCPHAATPETKRRARGPVEVRMAELVQSAQHAWERPEDLRKRLIAGVGRSANLDKLKQIAERTNHSCLARRVALISPFWVREPVTWRKGSVESFLDHVFVLHDVPKSLYSEWLRKQESTRWLRERDSTRYKWLWWFILLGQGGSLKKAAKHFNWNIVGQFQHYLYKTPKGVSPTHACIHAEVLRHGGTDVDAARILSDPGFVVDPTEMPTLDMNYRPFWQETVRWIIAHRQAMSNDDCRIILAWAMHEYTESERDPNRMAYRRVRAFSWKGRRLRPTLERSIEYQKQGALPWTDYRWNGHGWDWTWKEPATCIWSFVELTSSHQLHQEGKAMHHCVTLYSGRCISGRSAVVSMRCNGERRLTIEISLASKQIVQARGTCNRAANEDEVRVMSRWFESMVQK